MSGDAEVWYLLDLGMAEYRSGHLAQAERTLLAAAEAGKDDTLGLPLLAAFYRAMCLFQQGKKDEARSLASHTAARMKLLPADEQDPLAGGAENDGYIGVADLQGSQGHDQV